MAKQSTDRQERLSDLWRTWGLRPDTAMGEAQRKALAAVVEWLKRGDSDPQVVIRAVQMLLLDPERPDCHGRPCWSSLRKAVLEPWSNVGTGPEDVLFGQALVLAAWPEGPPKGRFCVTPLLDGAWDVARGRGRQREALARWRASAREAAPADVQPAQAAPIKPVKISAHKNIDLAAQTAALAQVRQHAAANTFPQQGANVAQVLEGHQAALQSFNDGLTRLSSELCRALPPLENEITAARTNVTNVTGQLNLVWWGQARYCRSVGKPFRRILEADDILWWAGWEAAEITDGLDVEPCAAFVVETLHALGQDVLEKRPLRQWMLGLHESLRRAGARAPALCARTKNVLIEEALGLPVSWVRLRAAQNEQLDGADDAMAIDLDAEIDRGQWASWVFREAVLDLELAGA